MKTPLAIAALASLAACNQAPAPQGVADIRAAEARLVAHLEGPDPLAWAGDYTEDAVFQEGADAPVSGRAALTDVAKQLGGLSQVQLVPLRTLVQGKLAYVQVRGRYAVGQGAKAQPSHAFRGVMIWRRDPDGVWRMLHEILAPEPGGAA
jgi:ketosteroid isomerase-like protein